MKKFLVLGVSVVMLCSFTLQAEAGFSWGGIANKVANKAVDGIFSSGSKKKTENKAEKPKAEQPAASDDEFVDEETGEKVKITYIEIDGTNPTAFVGELDPWPPHEFSERPAWFAKRTQVWSMTNARLLAEYESISKWIEYAKANKLGVVEPDLSRSEEITDEIHERIEAVRKYSKYAADGEEEWMENYAAMPEYQRGVASNIKPLLEHGLELKIPASLLPGYHPERN